MASGLLNVVLCWHMHQPNYREGRNGKFHLPWVYLHGIKDYTDMATHLENHPQMSAVVNFSPVLLQQLDDYVQELDEYLSPSDKPKREALSDPLLALLAGTEPIPTSKEERKRLFEECKRCHAPRMIEPYPAFHRLVECLEDAFQHSEKDSHFPLLYLEDQFFYDLLVWYHLAWLGHSLKQSDIAQALFEKEHEYTEEDRLQLITIIFNALSNIIPRYRRLADKGQIELSLTPYAHPIVPLLNGFENMGCSLPDAPRPQCDDYPGGIERSRWHMQKGIESFQHYFGRKPDGVWLSEGGISEDAIRLLDEFDIRWTASGEQVWRNTCNLVQCDEDDVHTKRGLFRSYQFQNNSTQLYFRDDGLSDFIGFEYSHWNAQDAALHFVENLQNIARFLGDDTDNHVVSIILDGENAWEYYLDNGYHFLDVLYKEMTNCEEINVTTFSQTATNIEPILVDQLCAGSWVYGSFSTWVGQEDKNRAWEYLVAAKLACDQAVTHKNLSPTALTKLEDQLAICEGSDWFWWFGDYNPSGSVHDFDDLYRIQLKKLYTMIDEEPPAYLDEPVSRTTNEEANSENAGTMRRNA